MADLAIIVPTRGRPGQLADMCRAAFALAELDIEIWAGIDDDDPETVGYVRHIDDLPRGWQVQTAFGPRQSLSGWTNALAMRALESPDPPRYLASLGDDHRPRTPAWDRQLVAAIEARGGSGIAYGNDLLQGKALPTAWVTSADIVAALGWLMVPACAHMYVDNATLLLGEALDCITYVPEVVIEHVHPVAGKAAWDASYRESNHPERYAADRAAFVAWRDTDAGLAADADRVRAALGLTVHDARRLLGPGCESPAARWPGVAS